MHRWIAALMVMLTVSASAFGATRTVKLGVPGMVCPVCPITVKRALSKVSGVEKTEVDFDHKQATVTFDDKKTNIAALTSATAQAGYPSQVVTPAK